MNWKLIASSLLFASLAGCGTEGAKTDDRVHIRGSVGQELRAADMRAVAIAGDGRWFSTAIDTRGSFDLALPRGGAYRVVITQGKTIVARVVLEGTQGKTVWIKGREASDVAFGVLRQTGTLSTQTLGESEDDENEGAEAEDESENETEEDEHGEHDSYDACSSGDEKELEPSNPSVAEKSDYEEEDDEAEHACVP